MRISFFYFITFIVFILPSHVFANDCKLTVGYSFKWDSDAITRHETYKIERGLLVGGRGLFNQHSDSQNRESKKLKHMRFARLSYGDYDVSLTYKDALGEHTRLIRKEQHSQAIAIKGNLKLIQCVPASTVFPACKLTGYFADKLLWPYHNPNLTKNYAIPVGETVGSSIERKHLRKIVNNGAFDAKVTVRGIGPSSVKRINPGDNYIGQSDLRAITCVNSDSAKLTWSEKVSEDIENAERVYSHYRSTWERLKILLNWEGEILSAPASCNSIVGRNIYGNRYSGSRNKFLNFDITQNFSRINNYLMMQAAGKTYYDQIRYRSNAAETDVEFMCGTQELYNHWGFSKVQFVNTRLSANAIVASNDDMVVIAIRGTQDPTRYDTALDIVKGAADISASSVKVTIPADLFGLPSRGWMHTGYAVNAMNLSRFVADALDNIDNVNRKKIFVTGHSLGGSTAIMLSAFLNTKTQYKTMATYAFAAPEVGNERFTRDLYHSSPYYLTNNYRDPIPNVNRKPFRNAPTIGTGVFSSALYASRYSTVFRGDAEHTAQVFPTTYSSRLRNAAISRIQGGLPHAFLNYGRTVSPLWHYHTPSFYVAHTYSELLRDRSFRKRSGSDILPEFSYSNRLCISTDGRTSSRRTINWDGNGSYELLKSDKQPENFRVCP